MTQSNLTAGGGIVKVPHPRQYDVPPSGLQIDFESEAYGTTVTHQLHCLV